MFGGDAIGVHDGVDFDLTSSREKAWDAEH